MIQNKISRTEDFLIKLQKGEKVSCYSGIIQCHSYVGHLAAMISKVILEQECGIFHMSATTGSEDYKFMKKLAR